MDILAYSAEKQGQQVLLRCSDGNELLVADINEAITFLLAKCDYAVVWNIDYFANNIISLLYKSEIKVLNDKCKVVLTNSEKLYYQVGRVFAITYASREVNFYGLHRYSDEPVTNVNELAKLADDVIEAYGHFGLEPKGLSSPVAVYGEVLDKLDFPRACDLPDSSLGMINACLPVMWREWREVFKLGHWEADNVTDYDLSGAYPSLIARLPDISKALFYEADEMPSEYSWGELQGTLRIDKDVTPFKVGEYEDSITTEQLWAINKYDWGEFKLKHGYFLQLPKVYRLPFKDTMQALYQKRYSNNLVVQKIAKAISVGIGGKFAQIYDDGKLGDNCNPIYARMITSRCSIKVADFLWRHGLQNDTISVLVDGCLVQGNYHVSIGNKGMGSWRVNPKSPFLVASLLYAWGNDKKPNGLSYDEMMALIKAKPNESVYGDIDLNLLSHDRAFKDKPRCGSELLNNIYNSENM